jgi:lysophospholipase L1-like esterase
MKKVVLLGDSIRMGYEATVRAELADEAFVWGPAENGQHTVHLLLNFWQWAVQQQPDVLHMNAGAWDTRRVIRGQAGNIVPLEMYRENVARLITLARQHTGARLIWATCTWAHQEQLTRGHERMGLAGREAEDLVRYNQAAAEIAQEHGVPVNDLQSLSYNSDHTVTMQSDGVHFTEAGYQMLGKAVAAMVRRELAQV